jgi:hypothetical protein
LHYHPGSDSLKHSAQKRNFARHSEESPDIQREAHFSVVGIGHLLALNRYHTKPQRSQRKTKDPLDSEDK